MMTEIVKFDPLKAEVAKYKEMNKTLEFDYKSKEGNAAARSHIFKLRKTKTRLTEVHREVKAEALATCQAIDGEKRYLMKEIEGMIEHHDAPLREIKQEEERKTLEIFKAKEAERLAEEARIQKELEDREAEIVRKEAEIKAKEDAIKAEQEKVRLEAERAERDKHVAQEAVEAARKEAEVKAAAEKKAVEDAAAKKIADAKAEALAKENDRLAKEAAAKAEKERLAEAERIRTENETHRKRIRASIANAFFLILKDGAESSNVLAEAIVLALDTGKIPNVTINY